MIFAGKSTVDELTNGSRLMDVIQNHNQWDFRCAGLPIDLVGQVGEIKLQILRTEKEVKENENVPHQVIHRHTDPHLDIDLHLARLAVHVESDHDAIGDFAGAAIHQILSKSRGKVTLPRPTGPREDETAVFEEQADVVLHHGFGDESFKYQAVYTFLLQA